MEIIQKAIENIFGYSLEKGEFLNITKFIDTIIGLIFVIAVIVYLVRHTKNKSIIAMIILLVIASGIACVFGLSFTTIIILLVLLGYSVIVLFNTAPEYKNKLNSGSNNFDRKRYLTSEEDKQNLIETLIKTVDFLSARKTGAIITIERENSLNQFVEKATKLNSMVTFELLTTIFYNGTALHDGAVIIRGNEIACAAAFYPSSDNAAIPKHYGSRHRAGLGISEETDSFTIVVSEETGNVATMAGGVINPDITLDALKDALNQVIIVK